MALWSRQALLLPAWWKVWELSSAFVTCLRKATSTTLRCKFVRQISLIHRSQNEALYEAVFSSSYFCQRGSADTFEISTILNTSSKCLWRAGNTAKHRCTNMENLQAQNILTCSHTKMRNVVKFITWAPPGVSPEEYLHNQAVKSKLPAHLSLWLWKPFKCLTLYGIPNRHLQEATLPTG